MDREAAEQKIRCLVMGQVMNRVWLFKESILDLVWNRVCSRVNNHVRKQVREQIATQVMSQVWGQVCNRIWNQAQEDSDDPRRV